MNARFAETDERTMDITVQNPHQDINFQTTTNAKFELYSLRHATPILSEISTRNKSRKLSEQEAKPRLGIEDFRGI